MKAKEERKTTCQDCRWQTNKPSYCMRKGDFVPRKDEACHLFAKKRVK